jgi:hypothetical protein
LSHREAGAHSPVGQRHLAAFPAVVRSGERRTFILGPVFVVGVGNGLILGYLMFRSGFVPRPMAVLGLIGGPPICASEIWLTVKGFKPSPITSGYDREVAAEAAPAVA